MFERGLEWGLDVLECVCGVEEMRERWGLV